MQIGDQYLGRANWNIGARDVVAPSVLSLLASNAALIIWAIIERWPLVFVVCVYWAQSVIIGFFWLLTILTYGKIYRITPVDDHEECSALGLTERAQVAGVFALHYGMFHVFFLLWMLRGFFLPVMERIGGDSDAQIAMPDLPLRALLIFAGAFFISRLLAFLREQKEFARKQANAAKLTVFPYARIVPMHLATFIGAALDEGGITPQSALVFFLLLKTAADVFMHIVQSKGFGNEIEPAPIDGSAPRIASTLDGPVLLMPGGRRISLADKPQILQKLRKIAAFPRDIRIQVCQSLLNINDTPQEQPALEEIACRCRHTDFIDGESAVKYVDGHLNWLETAEDGLTARYICPETRKTWVMVAGALKAEQPKSDEALCRCAQIDRLDGKQAQEYAKEHLKAVETDGGWQTTYICPYTDKRWLLDYTKMADHDQAQYARLRPLPPKTTQQ